MGSSMPSVISPVLRIIRNEKFTDVLDIGVGESGMWGLLIRDKCDTMKRGGKFRDVSTWKVKIVGIEICEHYKTPVHQYIYDKILWMDVFEAFKSFGERACDPKFDLVMLTAVIEHFEKEEGFRLLGLIKRRMRNNGMLVITTPNGFSPQRAAPDNPNEEHKSGWTIEDVDRMKELGYVIKHTEVTYDNKLILILTRK